MIVPQYADLIKRLHRCKSYAAHDAIGVITHLAQERNTLLNALLRAQELMPRGTELAKYVDDVIDVIKKRGYP